jgi:DNA polymerase alpha subunit B
VLDIPGADTDVPLGSLGLYRLDQLAKDSEGRRRVHCMPNPCTFQINEVVFGVTSTDVIFHMNAEETSANLPAGSRVRRIAQHMVQQQSYYPLFPPSKAVNLDLKQQDGWRMPVKADVLIAPTRLQPFCAPIAGSTMVVNPGYLTKRSTGGTYAVMELYPVDKKKLNSVAETEQLPHGVQDRLHVQVKRI